MGDAGALHVSVSDGAGAEGCVGVVGDDPEPPQAEDRTARARVETTGERICKLQNFRISEFHQHLRPLEAPMR
jgi:hypothetical protein